MNRINLPYSWKREDFKKQKHLERCNCVWNSFDRKVGRGCYTVIENCTICKETGLMHT